MLIQSVIDHLNATFHPQYQESYDNSGFLVGNPMQEARGVLVALDLTPDVIEEAVQTGCNLICTHHPFMFGGVKRITPATQEGRMIMMLLENHICHYAAHTNMDNMLHGVSGILADKLGVENYRVLRPMEGVLRKLVVYVPTSHAQQVREAMFAAGAGRCVAGTMEEKDVTYSHCSASAKVEGTFMPHEGSHPFLGETGKVNSVGEERIEVVYERHIERKLINKMLEAHPYEEPAYDLYSVRNANSQIGGGVIGTLPEAMPTVDFLKRVKDVIGIPCIRTSALCKETVKRVAMCGGSGNFMIGDAKAQGADIYLTGDLKYHDFQMAEGEIVLAEIGHYESEQFARELLLRALNEKFPQLESRLSKRNYGYAQYL